MSNQENYIRQVPARAPGNDPEAKLKALDLMSKAADSISDGDLLDRLIHRYVYPFYSVIFSADPYLLGIVPSNNGPSCLLMR